jgi:serine/threonine protein kinase
MKSMFIMEKMDCELWDFLKQIKDFDPKVKEKYFIRIVKDICSGLSHMHDHGFIHNDLSLNNIMISDNNGKYVFKLIDLGLSKNECNINNTTMIGGNFHQQSPEVFTEKYLSQLSEMKTKLFMKTDSWSFGIILYTFTNYVYPFDYNTENDLNKIVQDSKKYHVSDPNKKLDIHLLNTILDIDYNDEIIVKYKNPIIHDPQYNYISQIIEGFMTLNIKKRFDVKDFCYGNKLTLLDEKHNHIFTNATYSFYDNEIMEDSDTSSSSYNIFIDPIENEICDSRFKHDFPKKYDVKSKKATTLFKKITNIESTHPYQVFICYEVCLRYNLSNYDDIIILLSMVDDYFIHPCKTSRRYNKLLNMQEDDFKIKQYEMFNKIDGKLFNPHLFINANYFTFIIAQPIHDEIEMWGKEALNLCNINKVISIDVFELCNEENGHKPMKMISLLHERLKSFNDGRNEIKLHIMKKIRSLFDIGNHHIMTHKLKHKYFYRLCVFFLNNVCSLLDQKTCMILENKNMVDMILESLFIGCIDLAMSDRMLGNIDKSIVQSNSKYNINVHSNKYYAVGCYCELKDFDDNTYSTILKEIQTYEYIEILEFDNHQYIIEMANYLCFLHTLTLNEQSYHTFHMIWKISCIFAHKYINIFLQKISELIEIDDINMYNFILELKEISSQCTLSNKLIDSKYGMAKMFTKFSDNIKLID